MDLIYAFYMRSGVNFSPSRCSRQWASLRIQMFIRIGKNSGSVSWWILVLIKPLRLKRVLSVREYDFAILWAAIKQPSAPLGIFSCLYIRSLSLILVSSLFQVQLSKSLTVVSSTALSINNWAFLSLLSSAFLNSFHVSIPNITAGIIH